MFPVLLELGPLTISSYGVSKALAALVAGWLLARELRRVGREPDLAWTLAVIGLIAGFLGAKVYYLAENAGSLTAMDFGTMGFTWHGGLLGGALGVAVVARRNGLPLRLLAGLIPVPLSVAYGVGRLGCLLAGDGTYGTPSTVPWAMSFPNGTMPTLERVHPAPLYEALAAFAIAAALWQVRTRLRPAVMFGAYAVLSGLARLLVEMVRTNEPVVAGLTQPQLWSIALIAFGVGLLIYSGRRAIGKHLGVRAAPVTTARVKGRVHLHTLIASASARTR
ncbi:MAG: prolipoprotein diacylglyceryl transferase [Jiangellaceae bacterium]